MALIRFTLDLAIPETVFNTIPATKKLAFKNEVLALKALAVKINAGADFANGYNFYGYLGRMRICNCVLSATQRVGIYQQERPLFNV